VLLIDDQVPYHFKSQGLSVVASTDFLVLLCTDDLLPYDDAMAVLARSNAAAHLKRAAMIALAYLSGRRGE